MTDRWQNDDAAGYPFEGPLILPRNAEMHEFLRLGGSMSDWIKAQEEAKVKP